MSGMIKLGLLGNKLAKSRAKNLHELLGRLYGVSVNYEPMDLADREKPVSIQVELKRCSEHGFSGVNVTHPYKREAFAVVEKVPTFPEGLTSVNTVLFKDSGMIAVNTDYSGCCRAFRAGFGDTFKPGRVLMLGAGGVGVAIAFALKYLGAKELVVGDIDIDLARALVKQLSSGNMPVRLAGEDLAGEMGLADGLVNATPVGMFQYPGCVFPKGAIGRQQWAFDAVYTPENTEFLRVCRQIGIATLSGFQLFLFQGLDAFWHFTGIDPDAKTVERRFLEEFPLE